MSVQARDTSGLPHRELTQLLPSELQGEGPLMRAWEGRRRRLETSWRLCPRDQTGRGGDGVAGHTAPRGLLRLSASCILRPGIRTGPGQSRQQGVVFCSAHRRSVLAMHLVMRGGWQESKRWASSSLVIDDMELDSEV